jgi:hypothetical protein
MNEPIRRPIAVVDYVVSVPARPVSVVAERLSPDKRNQVLISRWRPGIAILSALVPVSRW